jgi:Fe-S-cluster containining protein
MGDDPSLYETVMDGDKIRFKKHENGGESCCYLGPQGCTIYDKRPWLCRTFDCRVYVLNKFPGRNRQERRTTMAKMPWTKAIIAAAKARL